MQDNHDMFDKINENQDTANHVTKCLFDTRDKISELRVLIKTLVVNLKTSLNNCLDSMKQIVPGKLNEHRNSDVILSICNTAMETLKYQSDKPNEILT